MIELFKDLGLNPKITTTDTAELYYLEMEYDTTKQTVISNPVEKQCTLIKETIELKPTENHYCTAFNYIMDKYVEKIKEVTNNWGDDVKQAYTINEYTDKKMISKLLKASNDIAMNGRIGLANFIIASLKYVNLLHYEHSLKYNNLSKYSIIKNYIISDECGDDIIIGRFPQTDTDLGVNIILHEDMWTKNLPYEKEDGKQYFDISYKIVEIGKNPHHQYIMIKN
jgi:hypothetical protein